MLLFRDAKTGGALPPKRRMETAHERLLPNRLAVQHAGAGDSNTAHTIAVLHPACRTDANTLVPLRTNRLHYADTHVELRGGSDHALVERVDQLRRLMHYSDRVLRNALGDDGHPRRLCHRVSGVERRVRRPVCITDENLRERTTLRYIHILHVYSDGLSHVHTTYHRDANCGLRKRSDRLHHTNTHLELCHGCGVTDMECLDQLRKFLRHSHRILHHSMGDDRHPRQLCDCQPHLIRCVWQPVRERATHLYQRTALGNVHVPNLHTRRGDLHPAHHRDANRGLSHRTNRLHHTNAHIKLCHRRDVTNLERVDEYGEYVYHACRAVVYNPMGNDRLKRGFGDCQPHNKRCVRK